MGILRSQQLHPISRNCSHPVFQKRLSKGNEKVGKNPASSVVKNLLPMQETQEIQVQPLGGENSLE